MEEMVKMVEAHLTNVSQEIAKFENQKTQIEEQIKNLKDYLEKGVATLEANRTEKAQIAPATQSPNLFQ